jgi:hypothetical protein
MPAPQIIPLPPFLEMSDGMRIVITAVDATTNATVSGVIVSGVSIDVDPSDQPAPPSTENEPILFLPGQAA